MPRKPTARNWSENKALTIKTVGYSISTVSVLLLGLVSTPTAMKHPLLAVALVLGMLASVAGMCCRWWTYWNDRERK